MAVVYDRLSGAIFGINKRGYMRVALDLPVGKVLDVACGSGRLLAQMDKRAQSTRVGLDLSLNMLKQVRKRCPNALLVQGSYDALPFARGAFDAVVETNALGGVDVDAPNVLAEMVRVCNPQGEVRLADYALPQKRTFWRGVKMWFGALAGDFPHQFGRMLEDLGCAVREEALSRDGLYRYFQASCRKRGS